MDLKEYMTINIIQKKMKLILHMPIVRLKLYLKKNQIGKNLLVQNMLFMMKSKFVHL